MEKNGGKGKRNEAEIVLKKRERKKENRKLRMEK